MSFKAFRENKILAKISKFTVYGPDDARKPAMKSSNKSTQLQRLVGILIFYMGLIRLSSILYIYSE